MDIPKITLQYTTVKELNGGFKRETTETKTYPCYLTNYAIFKGQQMGLIDKSIYDEMPFITQMRNTTNPLEIAADLKDIDLQFAIKAIYLGCIGANPSLADTLDFETFLQGYDEDTITTLSLYLSLVAEMTEKGTGNFAQAFELVTDHESKDGKK